MGQNGPVSVDQLPLRNVNRTAIDFSQIGNPQNMTNPGMTTSVAEASFSGGNINFGDPQATAMDLSPDIAGNEQQTSRGTSDHATPSTSSNRGSSHTSFTPPHFEDGGSATQPASASARPSNPAGDTFFQNVRSYGQFPAGFSPGISEANKEGPDGLPNSFAFPTSWDYSADGPSNTGTGVKDHNSTGMTPGATGLTPGATGMTPIAMPDGTWQINGLDGNEWMFSNWSGASPQT